MYTVTCCFCVVVKWSQVKGQNQYVWCVIAMDTRLTNRFIYIIAGPTGYGKKTFVTRLLRYTDSLIDWPPQKTDVVLRRMATYVHDADGDDPVDLKRETPEHDEHFPRRLR